MPAPLRQLAQIVQAMGWTWTDRQTAALRYYEAWLADEGALMGGIGPEETGRLWDRHLLDSLLFGAGVEEGASVLDVGSGVGLPGVPLAIAVPDAEITLVERSGRRADALRRVVAILGLEIEIIEEDVRRIRSRFDRVTFRASLPIEQAVKVLPGLVTDTGEGWFALGRGERSEAVERWSCLPPALPDGWRAELRKSPDRVLDSPSWLLRIGRW